MKNIFLHIGNSDIISVNIVIQSMKSSAEKGYGHISAIIGLLQVLHKIMFKP